MKLIELINLCTQLQSIVLVMKTTKSTQALEIENLKRRVKSLEKRRKSKTLGVQEIKGRNVDNLEAQLQAKLIKEERLARKKEEEANIALLESWDNTQAMMDVDFQLSKPPTKAQKRNTISTYLKNMAGYKHNQLKSKSYDEIQKMLDKEMKREKDKKQKGDDDQEEVEMKMHIKIVKDKEVAIDAIPLVTKPPVIVDYKIDKDGRMGYFKLIRAYESSKSYNCRVITTAGRNMLTEMRSKIDWRTRILQREDWVVGYGNGTGVVTKDSKVRTSQTDCVQDIAQRKKFKRLKASTAFKTKQTDAEQRRPTIKKLEVKQVEFKLGEDCWEIQVKSLDYRSTQFSINGTQAILTESRNRISGLFRINHGPFSSIASNLSIELN
ncbi:hypothetical protein Tco_1134242 [Tanacetum coccineum]